MIFLVFKALPSKMHFLQKLHPTFSKLDILKMSIFQNLQYFFFSFFLLKIIKENGYIECYHLSCYFAIETFVSLNMSAVSNLQTGINI